VRFQASGLRSASLIAAIGLVQWAGLIGGNANTKLIQMPENRVCSGILVMNFAMRPRLATTLLLATALAASPVAAEAGWHGGGGGNFVGGALLGLGLGAVVGGALAQPRYAPPPVYYAPPPPVYYAPPPPVYYAPGPPVYYAPPPGYYAPPPGY
jgi:hypothetical protein